MRGWILVACLAAAGPAAAGTAGSTVVSGKSAQALRCAAYIGMAAQYGHVEGVLTTGDRTRMTLWSVLVLERWVPLAPEAQMAAYRAAIGELGDQAHTYGLISRHAEWCLDTFRPDL